MSNSPIRLILVAILVIIYVNDIEWDSNVITPGTEFMFRLSKAIEFYILERTQTHPDWKGVKSVYSDGSVPGEGEHKILDFIRS